MRVISPLDLRRSLGAILDAASAGERFLVERDRRPLAMLVSVADGRRLEPDPGDARRRRLEALGRLEALAARQAAAAPAGPSLRPAPSPGPTPSPRAADRAPADPGRRGAMLRPASSPLPADRPRSTPGSSAGAAANAAREPLDRHRAERVRHAGEDLVGLG